MKFFGLEFSPKNVIDNPSDAKMRGWALEQGGKVTQVGNLSVVTRVRSRSAKFTEVFLEGPSDEQLNLMKDVFEYLKGKDMIQVDRTMCQNPEYWYNSRVYTTKEYARVPLMWGNTLFPHQDGDPDFVTITVPEWEERKVLVFPEEGLTIILGTDYKGENKKAMLRQIMYRAKKRGFIGLHAGGKILRLEINGELTDRGFLFFGLSGTGKTSLSCHSHWLEHPERAIIRQDDVVILRHDGSCIGTEESYYIKTDALEINSQPLIYSACLSPRAILENVMVHDDGTIDFFDTSLTSNGRAMVKRGDVAFTDDSVDLPKVNHIVFITRREDIVPPIARLTPEWGAAAFMLGESVETSAGDPEKAGQALRVVGTNPFIVGSESEEGNIFLDILRKNPDIKCYMMNTGKVGGPVQGEKITVRDSVRIIEMIGREEIKWENDPFWGYEVPTEVPGLELERFRLENYYQPEAIATMSQNLKKDRLEWLLRFEELNQDVTNAIR